jgi:hypothetical protein
MAPVFMCLYPRTEDVYVSGDIESHGSWPDCHLLTNLLLMRSGAAAAQGNGTAMLMPLST